MGSPCELALYIDPSKSANILSDIRETINQYEKKYSRYLPDSVISFINQSAGSDAIAVDEETAALLNYADVLFHQSQGLFDITSGVLRKIWDFKQKKIPGKEEQQSILNCIGWKKVSWNPPYIQLPENMQLDFGGIVKEYVADTIANRCRQQEINHGLINLGGDIHVIGPHPNGAPWRVGIQHPRKQGEAITYVELYQGALATSGDYERYMIIDNKRYSHLLNPLTAEPIASHWASVSVIASQCVIAGSYTTIALLSSEQKELSLLEESNLPYLCITQDMELIGSMLHEKHKSNSFNPS
jgi:thiamine biosynthesis lipoprotein